MLGLPPRLDLCLALRLALQLGRGALWGPALFAATFRPCSQARASPAFAQYVAGVSLGAPCEIAFVENRTGKRVPPKGARKVRLILP